MKDTTNNEPGGSEGGMTKEKLDMLKNRPDAGTGENPKLDELIRKLEDYLAKRKKQLRHAKIDPFLD